MIELHNLETKKMRLVSLKSYDDMEIFIDLFNLISCFRTYEAKIADHGGDKDSESGPQYIPDWVKSYTEHRGIITFTNEILMRKNVEYMIYFTEENSAIKGIVFDESLLFSKSAKR